MFVAFLPFARETANTIYELGFYIHGSGRTEPKATEKHKLLCQEGTAPSLLGQEGMGIAKSPLSLSPAPSIWDNSITSSPSHLNPR